jgi:hypothetical protein
MRRQMAQYRFSHWQRWSSTFKHLLCAARAAPASCRWDRPSPKIGDVLQRRKLSTTIGANSYAYLRNMVKAGKAESVGEAVDKAVEIARRLDNRATLERQTAAYFKGLTAEAAAEEADLEDVLSIASQEMDVDQP